MKNYNLENENNVICRKIKCWIKIIKRKLVHWDLTTFSHIIQGGFHSFGSNEWKKKWWYLLIRKQLLISLTIRKEGSEGSTRASKRTAKTRDYTRLAKNDSIKSTHELADRYKRKCVSVFAGSPNFSHFRLGRACDWLASSLIGSQMLSRC